MAFNKLVNDTKLDRSSKPDLDRSCFTAHLHPDWQVWYPNGGYLSAMALRAASECTGFEQPRSFSCHFLSVPKIGSVEIEVRQLRQTKFADSLSVSMMQADKPILQAITWFGDDVPGYQHDDTTAPIAQPPQACKATTEIDGGHASHPFWNNIEQRPVSGKLHWQLEKSEPALQQDWIRFQPDVESGEIALDMMRYIVLLDTYAWPAAARAHAKDGKYIAPTLSLSIEFHRHLPKGWILSDASVPVAQRGYMNALNRLWSEQGDLLATATATLMCRPRPA